MPLTTPITQITGRDVVSIEVNQTIMDAIEILTQGRFHHLPVVDDERLVGMLSTVDLLKLNSDTLTDNASQKPALLASRACVRDIMVTELAYVSDRATLADAAQLLSSGEFHAVPVVAGTGKLVGIVTTTDLINHMLEAPAEPEIPESVRLRMQLLEKIYKAAQGYLDAGMTKIARDSLEHAVQDAQWSDA